MNVQCIAVLVAAFQVVWGRYDCGRDITIDTDGNNTEDCLKGDYPCSTFEYALYHLQSNDCVTLTFNSIPFSTVVELYNLDTVNLNGLGHAIVMCNNTGRLSCTNCSNVVMEGITWDSCGNHLEQGSEEIGGIYFNITTNLLINNCSFQHSSIRALSLANISGSIQILHTRFMDNANNETIYCAYSQYGFVHCTTTNFTTTGALRIQSALNKGTVNISHCVFHHNGHFGRIKDTESRNLPRPGLEIADGAGLLIVLPNSDHSIDISIENTHFSSNRGRSGAGALINTKNSNFIKLIELLFCNNSVIKFYINASALMVDIQTPLNFTSIASLQLLSCNFFGNYGGRNVIGYIVGGDPAHVDIEQCMYSNNSNYDVGMIDLNIQSNSQVRIYKTALCSNHNGSALVYMQVHSRNVSISFNDVTMIENIAGTKKEIGGLLIADIYEDNCIMEITKLSMTNNTLQGFSDGGGIYITGSFWSAFKCLIHASQFKNNFAFGTGTVIYSSLECENNKKAYLMQIDDCLFTNNTGNSIVYVATQCYELPGFLILNGEFTKNTGSPLKLFNTILVGNDLITFNDNLAEAGAALCLTNSYILLNHSSFHMDITNNFASLHGGGIYTAFLNRAQCHWLLYSQNNFCNATTHIVNDCETRTDSSLLCNELPKSGHAVSTVNIINNTALLSGSAIFYDGVYNILQSRRSTSDSDATSIFYTKDFTIVSSLGIPLATQPELVMLQDGACCDDNFTACTIPGITLGQGISIPAKIIGYNNKSAEPTRFLIDCTDFDRCKNFSILDDTVILISKKLFGVTIVGDKVTENFTLPLKLSSGMVFLNLSIEIVPCHLGHVYNRTLQKCVCYDLKNIVSCEPITTIKKGYWFGMVDGQDTTSPCPEKYCNFDRTEVIPGRFELPVGYDDQCYLHRTGPACGKCEEGYTLSFDFNDCIDADNCELGIVLLVLFSIILYWFLIVVAALGLMNFKINMGYLYGIIYYYSVVDILLGQVMHYSFGLETVEKILLSIVGLSPGFLSKLCFIRGISGIDQYAFHYIHPTAISLILLLLAIYARHSRRFAGFVSRGIIRVICLILTLTYTSIAKTSLQLFQPLEYQGNDKMYCYLSPHIGYLTERHVVYFIIAVLFQAVIVTGLPLLLLLEPFVNHRINFTRIKPLLDQFQGCYKDRYRWFAAVYFLCRQVILVILVISYNDQLSRLYLLAVVCVSAALLHFLLRPYIHDTLNQYDGIVLQLLILVVSLQIVSVSELSDFANKAIIGMAYGMIILPVVLYIMLSLYIRRDLACCCFVFLSNRCGRRECRGRRLCRDEDNLELIPLSAPQENHVLPSSGLRYAYIIKQKYSLLKALMGFVTPKYFWLVRDEFLFLVTAIIVLI